MNSRLFTRASVPKTLRGHYRRDLGATTTRFEARICEHSTKRRQDISRGETIGPTEGREDGYFRINEGTPSSGRRKIKEAELGEKIID